MRVGCTLLRCRASKGLVGVGPRKLGQRLIWPSERCSEMERALCSTLSSNPYRHEGRRGGAYCGDLYKVTSVMSSSCSHSSPVKVRSLSIRNSTTDPSS